MKTLALTLFFALSFLNSAHADQFLLFDKVFIFIDKDAILSKSHLFVKAEQFGKNTPQDWTSPIDYRNGTAHIRIEILEKPKGEIPTTWSLCYIPNKGQKNNYGCLSSPIYTKIGVFEKNQKMTEFWENDSIIWSEGINRMSLVIKRANAGGKAHAHLQPDLTKFFPTKIRVSIVQVSKGSTYDPSMVPGLNAAKNK